MRKCVDGNQLWRESKHYSVNAYRISSDPDSIMAEVYMNGPVEVSFTVYEVKFKHSSEFASYFFGDESLFHQYSLQIFRHFLKVEEL